MQREEEELALQMVLLSGMQTDLKEMQTKIMQRLEDLELQQEELRQYHMQVIRTLATFRSLLEQDQRKHEG